MAHLHGLGSHSTPVKLSSTGSSSRGVVMMSAIAWSLYFDIPSLQLNQVSLQLQVPHECVLYVLQGARLMGM